MKRRLLMVGLLLVPSAAIFVGILPHVLPRILCGYRSDIAFAVPTVGEKRIYLSIDDAPSTATPRILEILAHHRTTATFFIIADRVSNPAQLEAILAGGHALGHHMKTTMACSRMSQNEFERDFDTTDAMLRRYQPIWLFRPSSDFGTREEITHAARMGYTTVVGTIVPLDHWIQNPTLLKRIALWLAIDGGIIILHDGAQRGVTTAEVLDELIPAFPKDGYTFGRMERELAPIARARIAP